MCNHHSPGKSAVAQQHGRKVTAIFDQILVRAAPAGEIKKLFIIPESPYRKDATRFDERILTVVLRDRFSTPGMGAAARRRLDRCRAALKAATIAISGSKGLTSPHGYDEGKAMLLSGRRFQWPIAPLATMGTADLTRPFLRTGVGYVVGVLVDPSRDVGFIAAINPTQGLLLGYCFSRSDFPWITVWEENLAVQAVP